MAAALVGLVVGGANAQVTTERSASLLVFPKVISDGTRDTIIQITNTSNSMVHAHCFYVNGALTFPDLPPGPINPPLWVEIDFDIWLTKQQPTHWLVSEGRLVNAFDPRCDNNPPFYACNAAGIDPGRVPPVVEYFTGELKCIEVDATGMPVSGNHLKGEATLVTRNVCDPVEDECTIHEVPCTSNMDCEMEDPGLYDVAKYNAIGVLGNENNNGDGILCLGGEVSPECPLGAEYDACPQFWLTNTFSQEAPDPVDVQFDPGDDSDSEIETSVTIVPCTQNFETQVPETVTIFIESWNEFEQPLSAFATVTCWDDLFLDEISNIFDFNVTATSFLYTRWRPTAQTRSGFFMVGEEFHTVDDDSDPFTSSAAVNHFVEGFRTGGDIWTVPAEQITTPGMPPGAP
jgi:hypothetical protein